MIGTYQLRSRGRLDAILEGVSQAPPTMDMRDEFGVVHYIWRIDDERSVSTIQSIMADKKLVIADGHHRYETALAYRDEQRAKHAATNPPHRNDYEKVMMTLVNSHSKGLTILPTHRVVAGLPKFNFARASETTLRILRRPRNSARRHRGETRINRARTTRLRRRIRPRNRRIRRRRYRSRCWS